MYRCRPKVYQLWYTGTYCTEVYTSAVASICLCELEGLSRCNITINMSKLLVVLCVFDWSCPKCLSPTYFVHAKQYLYTLDILQLVCIRETSHHPRERTKRRTERKQNSSAQQAYKVLKLHTSTCTTTSSKSFRSNYNQHNVQNNDDMSGTS